MKTILAPTDFSDVSLNAVHYAADLAKSAQAKLILFNVFQVPVVMSDSAILTVTLDELEEISGKKLKFIETLIREKHSDQLEISSISVCGFPTEEIQRVANENQVDLIVMGLQGSGSVAAQLMGSNTTSLMETGEQPVLVINENVRFRPLQKIVLACDYKNEPTSKFIEPLKEFIEIFDAKVYAINVSNEEAELSVQQAATGVLLDRTLEGTKHSLHFMEDDDLIEGINDFVDEKDADLLVFMPHKQSFLKSLFHRSNTKRMAFHTRVPLLSIHE